MMAAGAILKSLYSKLFRVTCVAHLLHNCAMKVKSHFESVMNKSRRSNQQQLITKPDKPNSLLLVARLSQVYLVLSIVSKGLTRRHISR